MKFKKMLALVLACVMMLGLLAGCGGSNAGGSKETPDTTEKQVVSEIETVNTERASTLNSDEKAEKLTVAIGSDPQDLLPCNYNTGDRKYIFRLIYQGLFYVPSNDVYEPLIAKGYTEVDELHWDVEIYDNVYDSKGNHITADDVVYSYDYLQTTGYAVKYNYYESIEKIDDYTVRFTWSKPLTGLGAVDFVLGSTIIFDKDEFEKGNFATDPVGTGRYVVESFTSGSSVVCTLNENYWQADAELAAAETIQSNVKTVQFDVIAETASQIMALQTGKVDYIVSCPATSVDVFLEGGEYAEDFNVINVDTGMWYYITPNQYEGKIGADKNFRLACYYALDNNMIAKAIGNATALTTIGYEKTLDAPEEWFSEETYINTYDPAKAADYLAQSSYNGEKIRIMGDNSATAKAALTVIQQMLMNVGIDSELVIVEANMLPNYCADTEAWELYFTFGSGATSNIINGLNRILNRDEYGNHMSFGFIGDDDMDALFNEAYSKTGHNDESMTALKDYLLENAYHNWLFTTYNYAVASNRIAEVVFFPGGSQPNFSSFEFYLD